MQDLLKCLRDLPGNMKIAQRSHCFIVYIIISCYFFGSCCSTGPIASPKARCLPVESSSLLQLKQEFVIAKTYFDDASGARNIDSWNASSDCCLWGGVACNMLTGHVISLDLRDNGLRGPLHSNSSLFSLEQLQRVNLAFNNFTLSPIPSRLGQLSRLTHLNFSHSMLSRKIPSEISLLSNLVSLDLSGNYLTYAKEDMEGLFQNATKLSEILLDKVDLSSSVPKSILNLSSLTSLSLSGCNMQGKFPEDVFQLPNIQAINVSANKDLSVSLPQFRSSVRLLDLSFTHFLMETHDSFSNLESLNVLILRRVWGLGFMPTSIGCLKSLNVLDLAYCKLSEDLSSWVGNLSRLSHLDLSNNYFIGHLPVALGNLSQLTYLDLSHNYFNGQFPSVLRNLYQLTFLSLSDNDFGGYLPFSLGNNLAKLTSLELASNKFSNLPSSLGNFSQLIYLDLSDNYFHGNFPISLANLTQLLSLNISNNHFSGLIPPNVVESFNSLTKLDLSMNSFIGVVPSSVFSMPSLKNLVLDDNQFTGPLSVHNTSSSSLTLLSLNGNKLNGKIPRSISKLANLRSLLLGSNDLTGEFDFGTMQELNILDLSNNSLSGALPQCFPSSLLQLNLQDNNLHGKVPEMCADECNLIVLSLRHNQLEGPIPRSLAKCRELRILDLGHNQIIDTFPFSLQALPKLAILSLRHNKLHGPVWEPGKFWGFADIHVFDISSNKFNGGLPSDYFSNWSAMDLSNQGFHDMTGEDGYYRFSLALIVNGSEWVLKRISNHLNIIDLSNNQFHGEIPETIGALKNLIWLNLSGNIFTGLIPSSLGSLTELETLDLSRNKLSGRIPAQFVGFAALAFLDVSHNQLTGPIPHGAQFNTFDNSTFKENVELCGFPLSNACEDSATQTLKSESDDDFGWKAILIGYGCGLAVGLIAGHVIIPWKLNCFVATLAEHFRSRIGTW